MVVVFVWVGARGTGDESLEVEFGEEEDIGWLDLRELLHEGCDEGCNGVLEVLRNLHLFLFHFLFIFIFSVFLL
jgi:hypothetical protein